MSNNEADMNVSTDSEYSGPSPIVRVISFFLVILILAGTSAVAYYWVTHKPVADRRPPKPQAILVDVKTVAPETERVIVKAMGTIVPAREVALAARVSGQIANVNPEFVPGGHFSAGEQIVSLDPTDYRLAIEQRKADLTKARSDLALEKGKRAVAESEYKLLGKNVSNEDKALLMREPQLQASQAAVANAEAALKKAELDLQRTTVTAPFNAVVQSRNVELGAQVSASTPLATLVGTDEYWVQVLVPMDQLKWIDIPGVTGGEGSTARVYDEAAWGKGAFREGVVRQMMVDLEPQGRMARLLIAVPDPLCLATESTPTRPMTLGSYVRVEIQGKDLPNVIRVPRTAFHDGSKAYVMTPDNKLEVRDLEVGWSCDDYICACCGLNEGDKLIVSDLAAPVEGMALRTADMSVNAKEQARDKRKSTENEQAAAQKTSDEQPEPQQ